MLTKKRRKTRIKKAIALFMLFTLANQLLAPTVAYALTGGPTAPEATNFEPVDTTDMVNQLTGSFTYNMPLLEVPGPEGSYPLALSYHAGIQPNEEASWVGLGWSLNPGAIARNVNGYADDWSGAAGAGGTSTFYWSGGSQSTYSVGVSVGISGTPTSVNAGLSFSEDTYKGFGVGGYVGVGLFHSALGASIGVSAYGGVYAQANVSYNTEMGEDALGASTSLSAQTNFHSSSLGFSSDMSLHGESLLGASIRTGNTKYSYSVGGGSSTSANNTFAGSISTQTNSQGISIPINNLVSIELGYSVTRYWAATTTTFNANGVINNNSNYTPSNSNNPNNISSATYWTNNDDDNYSIVDPVNSSSNNDPLTVPGGTFPNFDDYTVTAQGLGGSMRPYIFASELFNQSRINNSNGGVYDGNNEQNEPFGSNTTPNPIGKKWQFRFINDMSNAYTQQHPWVSDEEYGFDGSPVYGNNDGTYGYDATNNRLEGSKHIEYFTNAQISSGYAAGRGFITCPDEAGFARANCPASQIGGFMITNSSGVTYHYALPAYSSMELSHSEIINQQPHGFNSTDTWKETKYAYTWYLTAITGPDYVSRASSPGLIDPSDWGYWVKFDYGEWAPKYAWSTPSQGLTADIDGQFQTFSTGVKELYYLDAIITRSHTAIFEKELRADAKGSSLYYQGAGNPNPIESFIPSTNTPSPDFCPGYFGTRNPITNYPTATLRLKEILLFQNDQLNTDINTLRASSQNYNQSFTASPCGNPYPIVVHQGQFVIDSFDVGANSNLVANCMRRIVFNHDYSLCPGVPNSYDTTGINTYTTSPTSPTSFLGKLTLLSVDFQGAGGTPITPPVQFQYDLDPTLAANQGNITILSAPANQTGTIQGPTYAAENSDATWHILTTAGQTTGVNQMGIISVQPPLNFSIGDIVSFQLSGMQYYCTLLSAGSATNTFNVLFLNNSPGNAVGQSAAAVKTKNPPYNYDAYDNWQYYKSDYTADPNNIYFSRFTTPVSSVSTDVWSLRKIVSSVGANININYQSNTYNRSVLNNVPSVIVASAQINSDGTIDMTANGSSLSSVNLSQFFSVGGAVRGPLAFYRVGNATSGGTTQGYNLIDLSSYPQTTIVSVTGNDIKVKLDPSLFNFLNTAPISGVSISSATRNNLVTGNLCPNTSTSINYGGGIAVQSVAVDDLNGNVHQTAYNYGTLGSAGSTSGVTSYLPGILSQDNLLNAQNNIYSTTSYRLSSADQQTFLTQYHSILYKPSSYLLAVAKQVPAPGVLYETVAVNDNSILPSGASVPVEGTTLYQYEVFKPEMIGLEQYYYEAPNSKAGTSNGDGTSYHGSHSGNGLKIVKNSAHDVSIKDYTSRVGILKRIVTYDSNGNKLTEKISHYLTDNTDNTSFQNQVNNYEPLLAAYNNIGVVKERYATARASVDPGHVTNTVGNLQYDEMLALSNVETFPTIPTGTTQVDYKNGTTTNETNLAFDFYTGAVTQTLTTDSYGNRFKSVATPAYTVGGSSALVYPNMGLKTHDDISGATQHKQMLTQQASNYTFKVDGSNATLGVVTATAQTWSNSVPVTDPLGALTTSTQSNIWRMEKSLKWMPSGTSTDNTTQPASFVDYFASGGSSSTAWKKTAQITKYNVYSSALEATDIDNNYAATHMGYNNSKVLLTGGPGKYSAIAYSGFEDNLSMNGDFINNASQGSGTLIRGGNCPVVSDSTNAHTGTHALMASSANLGISYAVPLSNLDKTSSYSVGVWVKPVGAASINQASFYYYAPGVSITHPPLNLSKSAGGWYLLEINIPQSAIAATSGNLIVTCENTASSTLYFDDFRFQPTAAKTTAYVYDNQTGELTYILDNNNLFTRFQYDAIGRLVRTYREVLGKPKAPIVKAITYNYGRSSPSTGGNTYGNTTQSQMFYSQSCGSTAVPQPIVLTVDANTYHSTSVAAANVLAQNYITANGQAYANTNGACYVAFTLKNPAGAVNYHGYFTNTVTNQVIPFQFQSTDTTIGIPGGTYTVTVYPAGTTNYVFRLGDLTTPPAGPGCTFGISPNPPVSITLGGSETFLSISNN